LTQTDDRQKKIQSVAFLISLCVCVLFCGVILSANVAVLRESRGAEPDEKINPNEATVASLVRLPGIGESRAAAIVAYRESIGENGCRAFEKVEDLQKVRGIGPKTAENISEWLRFE